MKKSKILFLSLWFFFPLLAVLAILKGPYFFGLNTSLSVVNFLLRVLALVALPLLAWQITLGAFMGQLASKLGGWVAKYHFNQGIIIGTLILMHPLMRLVERYLSVATLNPFYIFTDVCLLCQDKNELYYSFGRFGFWLIVMAIIAAKLREWDWWKANWRYFHWANYLGFLVIFVHGLKIGTDFHSAYYLPLAYLSLGLVVVSLIYKAYQLKE